MTKLNTPMLETRVHDLLEATDAGLLIERVENLLLNFVMLNDLGVVDSEKALVGLTRNDYEPDICFWNRETANSFEDGQTEHQAPGLIVEVPLKSTTGRDRGVKFEDYAAHGVGEYWIIDPVRKSVEQYKLDEPTMAFASASIFYANDTLEAITVPGFKIPVNAISDKKTNMETLKALVAKST
jgi:Uma2 family endonuclease